MKATQKKNNSYKIILISLLSLVSCSNLDSNYQMKEVNNLQREGNLNNGKESWYSNFFNKITFGCYPKQEDREGEYDANVHIDAQEHTLEDIYPQNQRSPIEELGSMKNSKTLLKETHIIEESGCSKEPYTVPSLRRDPLDRNPYNFRQTIPKSTKLIKIGNFTFYSFERDIFPKCKERLSNLRINKFIPEQKGPKSSLRKKKEAIKLMPPIPERSNENNPNTGNSYVIESPKGHVPYNKYELEEKFTSLNFEGATEVSSEKDSYGIESMENYEIEISRGRREETRGISEKLFVLHNGNREEVFNCEEIEKTFLSENYCIVYNKIMPGEDQKIEALCTLPSVQELLLIFMNNIDINYTSFFNNKILTRTTIDVKGGQNNIVVTFCTSTNQLLFELLDIKNISKNEIHRISVQRLDSNVTEPVCCGLFDLPIFCCNQLLVRPKYLCHCCYCPPSFTCCDYEVEGCDCGVPNYCPCCCYLPSINGCCVTNLKL